MASGLEGWMTAIGSREIIAYTVYTATDFMVGMHRDIYLLNKIYKN